MMNNYLGPLMHLFLPALFFAIPAVAAAVPAIVLVVFCTPPERQRD